MNTYKLGSLFDGSGGFPLAGSLCGITPVWAAEIEPYPIAVTRSRFPTMKHLGDISKVNGADIEPVDIITFGSPCQDLSVAGKRAGLKHTENGDDETTRSGLFMEAIRIIKEMRDATGGQYPRWALWENVPGAFSSNKGEDFRVVCEELIKIAEPNAVMPDVPKGGWAYADSHCGDGWSIAYRVLDAQYWGVPQRRRRIYLVADFGGRCAREVLFEREGLRGYFAEGRTPGQATAGDAENSVGADDREGNCVGVLASSCRNAEITDGRICPCLMARAGTGGNQLPLIAVATQQGGAEVSENGVCPTITAAAGMSGNNQPWICSLEPGIAAREGGHVYEGVSGTLRANAGDNQMAVAYSFDPLASNSMKSKNPHSGCRQVDVARTIDTTDPNPSKNQGGIAIVEPVGLIDSIGGQAERAWEGEIAPCLKATHYKFAPVVCVSAGFCPEESAKTRGVGYAEEQAPTLRAGTVPGVVCKCFDARGNGDGDVCNTITGDHNNRITDYSTVVCCCIDGDKIGKAERSGGSGLGIREGDKMYTLTAKDAGTHGVCYGFMRQLGGVEAQENVSPTILAAAGESGNNKPCVAYAMETFHCQCEEEKTTTLKARDYKDPTVVCYALDRAYFNQGANALYAPQFYEDGTVPTLVARGPRAVAHGVDCRNATEYEETTGALQAACSHNHNSNNVVRVRYIVRRLTPTECARLQGFADKWGHIDPKSDFSDEDYRFWLDVRNTHAAINGKAVKDYSKAQMLTWYNKLHTDSSEYKLWGNGIALPCALYVLQGIADVLFRGTYEQR